MHTLNLSYEAFIIPLINSVKELLTKHNQTLKKIQLLEQENKELRLRLEKIEQKLEMIP
jgi:cell shape-determining protein MreC